MSVPRNTAMDLNNVMIASSHLLRSFYYESTPQKTTRVGCWCAPPITSARKQKSSHVAEDFCLTEVSQRLKMLKSLYKAWDISFFFSVLNNFDLWGLVAWDNDPIFITQFSEVELGWINHKPMWGRSLDSPPPSLLLSPLIGELSTAKGTHNNGPWMIAKRKPTTMHARNNHFEYLVHKVNMKQEISRRFLVSYYLISTKELYFPINYDVLLWKSHLSLWGGGTSGHVVARSALL